MKVFTDLHSWKQFRSLLPNLPQEIGFVPTMGNLHAGHEKLLQICVEQNPISILSIFINPTQFSSQQDFLTYPKTLEHDLQIAQKNHVSFVLAPPPQQLYPNNYKTKVIHSSDLSSTLEGKYRIGHFDGVLTIISKLFHLVQPSVAYFGEKDFQQLLLVKQLVDDLFFPITITSISTVREQSGLALSSRNSRLSPKNQQKAPLLFSLLQRKDLCCSQIEKMLLDQGFLVDYIKEQWNRRLAAVFLDDVRLIDNICLSDLR